MKITGARVYKEEHFFKTGDVYIRDGLFADEYDTEEVFDANGLLMIPGLVDIHFHGAMGNDFCDADYAGLKKIAEYEASVGVTAICPATMSYSEEMLSKIMENAAIFKRKQHENPKAAELVGINMEGPFISSQKLGAQNPAYIQLPHAAMVRRLMEESGGLIKMVDVAPEVKGGIDFIKEISPEVKVSIAHTQADYDIAMKAFAAGATHVTHLFNAMPPIYHRDPGPIIAALESGAEAEIIADGLHVYGPMVRFAFRTFGDDKMILISDSMEATGCSHGVYNLGGQEVTVTGNRAVLSGRQDVIAGSVTNLFDCMKTAVKDMGIPMEAAIRAATENPARSIGIFDRYGSITPGKVASAILMDQNMKLKKVILRGTFF